MNRRLDLVTTPGDATAEVLSTAAAALERAAASLRAAAAAEASREELPRALCMEGSRLFLAGVRDWDIRVIEEAGEKFRKEAEGHIRDAVSEVVVNALLMRMFHELGEVWLPLLNVEEGPWE